MKRISLLLMVIVVTVSCRKSVSPVLDGTNEDQTLGEKMSQESIDASIKKTVTQNGYFDWSTASDEMVWSALQHGDNVLSVGYKPANVDKDISTSVHTVDIAKGAWADARNQVLQMILQEERKLDPSLTMASLEAYDEAVLPVVDVRVNTLSTIRLLRKSNLVRYAEPMGYEPRNTDLFAASNMVQQSTSGCGGNVATSGLLEGVDYTTIAPGSKQSWNYGYHGIPAAWSKTSGKGRKVMIIDTGLSPDQALFSTLFNSGSSSGRTIERKVTLRKPGFLGFGYGSVETSTADACGHGTSMAGAAASPRNASGGAVGVAYNANLVTVRAAVDVLIDESRETKGVTDAFVLAGNSSDVNIVSMSMGRITSSSQIADAVNYAYNKGKLIFCAAGTSFGWSAGWYGVIFPATMANVNAVTGIQDNLKSRCNSCHDGPEVDFVVVMEKASNGRTALSTAQSGLTPSTVGGSSVATATTAGMAALIWAKNPTFTRDQVLAKMVQSSSYYPTKNGSLGWGMVNADLATN